MLVCFYKSEKIKKTVLQLIIFYPYCSENLIIMTLLSLSRNFTVVNITVFLKCIFLRNPILRGPLSLVTRSI